MAFPTYSDSVDVAQLQAAIQEMLSDRVQSGTVTITPSGAGVSTTQAVSFGRPFASTPRVALTINTGIGSTIELVCWASAVTASGFTANLRRGNTTATTLTWIATDL